MSELVQGSMFSVMVVRVDDPTDPEFESRLADRVARSPAFFANAPVVLDLKACSGLATVDEFQQLRALFRRQHLMPVGVQHANATQIRAAMNADLAAFPVSKAKPSADQAQTSASAPAAQTTTAHATAQASAQASAETTLQSAGAMAGRTRIVTQPVRSGAQIYARASDLIVMAPVSAGAEVIADGNVHIYSTLRGRAIAGAAGDAEARIFVGKLEAELLCVAGHYLVSDAIGPEFRSQPVQVALIDERLTIMVQRS